MSSRPALILAILLVSAPVFAQQSQQPAGSQRQQTAATSQTQQDVQQLQADWNALNTQQITVTVLQLQFTEELNKLRQMEAVFCDKHSLNVDKWRRGLYRFDPNENKFSEVEPTATESAPAVR